MSRFEEAKEAEQEPMAGRENAGIQLLENIVNICEQCYLWHPVAFTAWDWIDVCDSMTVR